MTGLFIAEQIKSVLLNLLTDQIESAGHAGVNIVRGKKQARDVDQRMEKLGQSFAGTVIDTDRFWQYYENYALNDQIRNYAAGPNASQVQEAFIASLVAEFDRYCTERGFQPLTPGERGNIQAFFDKILNIYMENLTGILDESQRVHLALNQKQLLSVRDQILAAIEQKGADVGTPGLCWDVSESGGSGAQQKDSTSPSAQVFQKRFHKRLFLDQEPHATLAAVYVRPRGIYMDSGDRVDLLQAVGAFLDSGGDDILIIEGVAGSGKSSFMALLSEIYNSRKYIYLSLKNLIKPEAPLNFRDDLLKECGLRQNDMDKVLLLDGLDEIYPRLDLIQLRTDLQWFCERGYRMIITTRPGYFKYTEFCGSHGTIRLDLFDDVQVDTWLDNYRKVNPNLSDDVCQALTQPQTIHNLDEIRRIPIMLYIIACRNINVETVACMGDLYEQVFETLKQDKGGEMCNLLDRHYLIAQQIAFMMYEEDLLTLTSDDVRMGCGDLYDDTFYSSVYIEQNIIEGTSILEFVHKSIMEFFAAKWIYNCIRKGYQTLLSTLSRHYLTDEVQEYLKYFYGRDTQSEMTATQISDAYRLFLDRAFVAWDEDCDKTMSAEDAMDREVIVFYNLTLLVKLVLGRRVMDDVINMGIYGRQMTRLLQRYLLDDCAKPENRWVLFQNENLSNLYMPRFLDFTGMNLENIIVEGICLSHVCFREALLPGAVFRDVTLQWCCFEHVKMSAVFESVQFDPISLKSIFFSGCFLSHMTTPPGELQVGSFKAARLTDVHFVNNVLKNISYGDAILDSVDFDRVSLSRCNFENVQFCNVHFNRVTMRQCDFSNVTIDDGDCTFSSCKIDDQTRQSNPGLFEAIP